MTGRVKCVILSLSIGMLIFRKKWGFYMAELDAPRGGEYIEDEFGLALKGFLIVRIIFYCIGVFMILGAVIALIFGATTVNDLVSNATALSAQKLDETGNFGGLQLCMYVQAIYTIASAVVVTLFYIKRNKLFAFIDLGLFVVFAAVFFIMGSITILGNGSAWLLYFLLNPVISFVALFAGKHFAYMPMM